MAGALLPARGTPKTPYPPPPTKEAVWTQQDQTASVTLPGTGRSCGFGGNPHYGQRNGRRTREHKYELGTDSPQRSEERRVGKECVRRCRSRWKQYHKKKKTEDKTKNR